jgi:hypothetical protein
MQFRRFGTGIGSVRAPSEANASANSFGMFASSLPRFVSLAVTTTVAGGSPLRRGLTTFLPCCNLAQWPRAGTGMSSRRHNFAKPLPLMPNSGGSFHMALAQTRS